MNNTIPNPNICYSTSHVADTYGDKINQLAKTMKEEFYKQPDICTDGGNDKSFFTFHFEGKKFFAAQNEVNGITIMFPEDY